MKTIKAWALLNGLKRIPHFRTTDGNLFLCVHPTKTALMELAAEYGQLDSSKCVRVEIRELKPKKAPQP